MRIHRTNHPAEAIEKAWETMRAEFDNDEREDKGAYRARALTLKDKNGGESENKEVCERWGEEEEESTTDWSRVVAADEKERASTPPCFHKQKHIQIRG